MEYCYHHSDGQYLQLLGLPSLDTIKVDYPQILSYQLHFLQKQDKDIADLNINNVDINNFLASQNDNDSLSTKLKTILDDSYVITLGFCIKTIVLVNYNYFHLLNILKVDIKLRISVSIIAQVLTSIQAAPSYIVIITGPPSGPCRVALTYINDVKKYGSSFRQYADKIKLDVKFLTTLFTYTKDNVKDFNYSLCYQFIVDSYLQFRVKKLKLLQCQIRSWLYIPGNPGYIRMLYVKAKRDNNNASIENDSINSKKFIKLRKDATNRINYLTAEKLQEIIDSKQT